eukprot:GCRY01001777.1.p1 GENE.GCRY01001777.1~~GCRY01001777.1.p1  ORF type:complete len:228 (+),score=16.89 GCRY01001777.1:144-827(+)
MSQRGGNTEDYPTVEEEDRQILYAWVDEIPLSKPKRNISRDFSDAVLAAEVVHHFLPKLVELHNYSPANSVSQKLYNWETLNQRVFKKLNFSVPQKEMENIVYCRTDAIERVLIALMARIRQYQEQRASGSHSGSVKIGTPRRSTSGGDTPRSTQRGMGHSDYSAPSESRENSREYELRSIIEEQERTNAELQETIEILEGKVRTLEQLVRLKDDKIQALQMKLQTR